MRNLKFVLSILLLAISAAGAAQQSVKISGEGLTTYNLTAADFKAPLTVTIKRKEHDGSMHNFSGIPLPQVLKLAGLEITNQVKGKLLKQYLLVQASDGYQVIFALSELDSAFTDNKIILANQMDGKPLAATKGPFQIIVQNDKKLARCVRLVTAITVASAVSTEK